MKAAGSLPQGSSAMLGWPRIDMRTCQARTVRERQFSARSCQIIAENEAKRTGGDLRCEAAGGRDFERHGRTAIEGQQQRLVATGDPVE
jgi:hypothetical protein